jgi:copper chaperone CopZ
VAVRTVLKRLDGVKEEKVNLSEKNAVVEYEPAKVKPQQMVDAVNRLGYQANLALAHKD